MQISTKEEIADVYLKNQRALFCVALTYVDSVDIAEEFVADAIVAVFEQAPTFVSEVSCLCYLKQTVRNKAINHVRKRYVIEPQEDGDIEKRFIEMNEYGLPFNTVEIQLLLHKLLNEYSKEIREAFIAHVIEQESIPVLASHYGIKPDTLRKHIGRIKAKISQTIPEKDMRAFLFMLMLLS